MSNQTPICINCKHYKPNEHPLSTHGKCLLTQSAGAEIYDPYTKAWAIIDEEHELNKSCVLITSYDFGCNQFEHK